MDIKKEAHRGMPRGRDGAKHKEIWACWHCYRAIVRNRAGLTWQIVKTTRGPKRHLMYRGRLFSACGSHSVSAFGRHP